MEASEPSAKKPKYQCKFQKYWESEFSGIKKSSKGESFVLCVYCNEHYSICHGGKNDVKWHVERQKHVDNAHLARQIGVQLQARLTEFHSSSPTNSFSEVVTKAEVLFA